MSSRPNSLFSSLTNLVSDSKFEDAPPEHGAPEYADYDIFQPRREVDAIIDNKLYLSE